MVAKGDVWEGHVIVSELDPGLVRTFLARQVGDTNSLVWLHMRDSAGIDSEVFDDDVGRLQRIAAQAPHIDPILYGRVSGSVAWVATRFYANAIRLKEATGRAELGVTAMKMAIELGEYLAQGNNLGWVHGTMNPEHVIITPDDGYVITHFGFVRLFEVDAKQAELEARYAAPELLLTKKPHDKRTDVYGLGTILYELICGRELYAGERNLAYCVLTRGPDLPARVPSVLREVVAKALAKEPLDRYPNAEHLLQVLRAYADDWEKLSRAPEVVEPSPDTLPSSPEPPSPVPDTVRNVSPPIHEGGEGVGTLDPPSPRVYIQPIKVVAPSSPEPTLAPQAQTRPGGQGRIKRPRSAFAALVVGVGSLSLAFVATMAIRFSERTPEPVARLSPVIQIVAPLLPRSSDDPISQPAAAPAAVRTSVTRGAVFARQSAERPASAVLQRRCDGPYACDPEIY